MIKENYRLAIQNRIKRIAPASDEEILELLAMCDADPHLHTVRDVVRIIANLGLHNSEFAALRRTDIDFEGDSIFVGRDRKAWYAARVLPLRPKVKGALISLHALNPESSMVLGDRPLRRICAVSQTVRAIYPELSRGRLTMYSVRNNFVRRLYSSGIPFSAAKYCLGICGESQMLRHLPHSREVKREILRRNLENFLPEF